MAEMLTVKEAADLLRLNEKVVYRLARQGRLPATRVTGKWLFPKNLLIQWLEANALQSVSFTASGPGLAASTDLFVAGSDDLILSHLLEVFRRRGGTKTTAFFAATGSMGGLEALARGKAHLAGIHLFSPETGGYNIPFLDRFLPGKKVSLFTVAWRQQGWIFNPSLAGKFQGAEDLSRTRLVNREPGSGTRLLLDYQLSISGLDPGRVVGYQREVFSHLEVGLTVLGGEAEVGLGIEPVARTLGLGFIPLARERYDLAVPSDHLVLEPVATLLGILQSESFKTSVAAIPGYDLSSMGKIVSGPSQSP